MHLLNHIQCSNKFQWRSCTDGHRSHQQRKRKGQTQRRRQRKERQQRKSIWTTRLWLRRTRQRKRAHWTNSPIQKSSNYAQGKGKGQGKANGQGKAYTTGCYRFGQQGHTAKDCRVAVHNIQEDGQENYNDATGQRYGPQTTYDNQWWTNDQTQVNAVQQPQQLALSAPSQLDATPALHIAAVTVPRNSNSIVRAPDMSMITNLNKDELRTRKAKPEDSNRRSH